MRFFAISAQYVKRPAKSGCFVRKTAQFAFFLAKNELICAQNGRWEMSALDNAAVRWEMGRLKGECRGL
jgi:hypothetical protein